jgi:intracellular multiplication protein IcmQ
MKNTPLSDEQVNGILDALQGMLKHGSWGGSAILRALGKKLQSIHDKFESDVEAGRQATLDAEQGPVKHMPSDTQQEVFVALYSSDGTNLSVWERLLSNLPRQSVSRPVYAHEEDVKRAIRSATNRLNEGYVSIYVDRTSMLSMPAEKIPKDKLGTELLTLKDNALKLNQLKRFVHMNNVYTYAQGRLKKIVVNAEPDNPDSSRIQP